MSNASTIDSIFASDGGNPRKKHTPKERQSRPTAPAEHKQAPPQEFSRLCVKNLPKYVNEDRLRKVFGAKGNITDLRLLRTPDGISRCLAFIGYQSPSMARQALDYFNRSFIDTRRITVEVAFAKHQQDNTAFRPWSKFSAGSSRFAELHGGNTTGTSSSGTSADHRKSSSGHGTGQTGLGTTDRSAGFDLTAHNFYSAFDMTEDEAKELQNNKKFREFMQLHVSRAQRKFWEDDLLDMSNGKQDGGANAESDDVPGNTGGQEGDDGDSSSDAEYDMNFIVDADEEKSADPADDSDSDSDSDSDKPADKPVDKPAAQPADHTTSSTSHPQQGADGASVTGRVFVRNLAYTVTSAALRDHFASYGEISSAQVMTEQDGTSKGFGFVQFAFPEDAIRAQSSADGTACEGRLIHVMHARPAPATVWERMLARMETDDKYARSLPYKVKVSLLRKSVADTDKQSWNTLFLRPDTVMSALARKFDIKSDGSWAMNEDEKEEEGRGMLLSCGALSVRMAVAETHLIQETKQWLTEHGVHVAAFQGDKNATKRSTTTLLLKNLPSNVDPSDIRQRVASYGPLKRFLMPPSNVMCLVEYRSEDVAKQAFRGMAYSKVKHIPLYVEWAPEAVFEEQSESKGPLSQEKMESETPGSESGGASSTNTNTNTNTTTNTTTTTTTTTPAQSTVDAERSLCTVFVRGFSSDATQRSVRDACSWKARKGYSGADSGSRVVPVLVDVMRKPNPAFQLAKRRGTTPLPPPTVASGHAFVTYATGKLAREAVRRLAGFRLSDGASLHAKLSHRTRLPEAKSAPTHGSADKSSTSDASSASEGLGGATKLLVRNVPFESTQRDLQDLFSRFGKLKSVRLPQKLTGGGRGFAFVDFETAKDAAHVLATAGDTHLLGRRLRLEIAQADLGLPQLRARAKREAALAGDVLGLGTNVAVGGSLGGGGGDQRSARKRGRAGKSGNKNGGKKRVKRR